MLKVTYVKCSDDRFERKGNCAYFFRNEETGKFYKWSTSQKSNYSIHEGETYFIKFLETDEVENNATRIKNVEIYEKLLNGELERIGNKQGTYKEWI